MSVTFVVLWQAGPTRASSSPLVPLPLKRAGNSYKGLCPFHSEKTPSFNVIPEKQFFHCFGCHTSGDVFKFLELHEKIGFQDAVRLLAQKFGLSIPEETEGGDDAKRDTALREALLKAHELAAAYFKEQLAGPVGVRARQQLQERQVTAQTIEQLGLGYAPTARDGLKAETGICARRITAKRADRAA